MEGLTFVKVELETEKDLIELIENEFRQPYNKKKKPSDVLDELGIRDTVILLDDFIEELFELYQFYKFDPSKLGKDFRWFEAYNIISRTEESQKPRMF